MSCKLPPIVTGVRGTIDERNNLSITWTKATCPLTSYVVLIRKSYEGWNVAKKYVIKKTRSEVLIPKMTPGKYHITVYATNLYGSSKYSDEIAVKVELEGRRGKKDKQQSNVLPEFGNIPLEDGARQDGVARTSSDWRDQFSRDGPSRNGPRFFQVQWHHCYSSRGAFSDRESYQPTPNYDKDGRYVRFERNGDRNNDRGYGFSDCDNTVTATVNDCPHCKETSAAEQKFFDKIIRCPTCNNDIAVREWMDHACQTAGIKDGGVDRTSGDWRADKRDQFSRDEPSTNDSYSSRGGFSDRESYRLRSNYDNKDYGRYDRFERNGDRNDFSFRNDRDFGRDQDRRNNDRGYGFSDRDSYSSRGGFSDRESYRPRSNYDNKDYGRYDRFERNGDRNDFSFRNDRDFGRDQDRRNNDRGNGFSDRGSRTSAERSPTGGAQSPVRRGARASPSTKTIEALYREVSALSLDAEDAILKLTTAVEEQMDKNEDLLLRTVFQQEIIQKTSDLEEYLQQRDAVFKDSVKRIRKLKAKYKKYKEEGEKYREQFIEAQEEAGLKLQQNEEKINALTGGSMQELYQELQELNF